MVTHTIVWESNDSIQGEGQKRTAGVSHKKFEPHSGSTSAQAGEANPHRWSTLPTIGTSGPATSTLDSSLTEQETQIFVN